MFDDVYDTGSWGSAKGRRRLGGSPEGLEPQLERLGLVATVELQVHGDEIRIVDGSVDLISPHSTGFAANGVAVERRLPGLEITDGMLDLQNWHWWLLSSESLGRYSETVSMWWYCTHMAEPVKSSRMPDYPRRRERARATRQRVLEAARELFIERGYVSTTIDSIAERADVSPETVYSTFGNKRSLLSELVDVSIAGDLNATPILERDWVQRIREEPDPHRRLAILTSHGSAILARRSAVDEVVRGAASADAEIAALRDRGKAQRHAGQRELLRIVAGPTGLREGLDLETAADILYAIGSPETYRLLVVDRGWTDSRFERWYGETAERLLLEPDP